ncbi:MAG: hypothetical protein CSB01_00595 [Bacteroidia bacterium]|nr:MAG: hypothetical protein CSB01_00595 [Bacteroidia bacterium]
MNNLIKYLEGGDLRSIADANKLVSLINSQKDFDALFQYLFANERIIVMRASDAVEKISLQKREYLSKHTQDIVNLMNMARHKELKWHLALIASRLDFTGEDSRIVWEKLTHWATNRKESRIVRVNSIQALFDLANNNEDLKKDFDLTIQKIKNENIPSINARLRKLGIN